MNFASLVSLTIVAPVSRLTLLVSQGFSWSPAATFLEGLRVLLAVTSYAFPPNPELMSAPGGQGPTP